MRLKIKLNGDKLNLPLSYQPILQGFLYNILEREELGDFYHNRGYQIDNKVYKMFVFSNLFGKYKIENKRMYFEDEVIFYFSAQDDMLLKYVYEFLMSNKKLLLDNQLVNLTSVDIIEIPYFSGKKNKVIKLLSPVVTYSTKDEFTSYYKPSDDEFKRIVQNNLLNKMKVLNIDKKYNFNINKINFEKKRIVRFKNTYLCAYMSELEISTNYETLITIYNCGLSAKGSSGFGMIDVK